MHPTRAQDALVRFLGSRRNDPERLLWSRDIRFVNRIAMLIDGVHMLELDAGTVVIGPAYILTEAAVRQVADGAPHVPEYGLVMVDPSRSESERYLLAMSAAVQVSGLADRIGMSQTSQVVQTKMLDYFFSLRTLHHVVFQPIVDLATMELHEYECMFRPEMPQLPQSIASVVAAAIQTERSVELDMFIVNAILDRAGRLEAVARENGMEPRRFAVNMTPASLLDPGFDAPRIAEMVRNAGLSPARITVECTEQQNVTDLDRLKRQVKALRRLGFGFAVDDAGAGYASFALVAALRPSIIKIDREITYGISRDDAKHALVEAFVSFGGRIGAKLVAEGIETRADLAKLQALGVDYGQGYLLGKPKPEPMKPRSLVRPKPRNVAKAAVGDVKPAKRRAARVPSRA
jgi:EAL domain-containing protein (putative c-di-GMP-specific phosphodiesterase class I)